MKPGEIKRVGSLCIQQMNLHSKFTPILQQNTYPKVKAEVLRQFDHVTDVSFRRGHSHVSITFTGKEEAMDVYGDELFVIVYDWVRDYLEKIKDQYSYVYTLVSEKINKEHEEKIEEYQSTIAWYENKLKEQEASFERTINRIEEKVSGVRNLTDMIDLTEKHNSFIDSIIKSHDKINNDLQGRIEILSEKVSGVQGELKGTEATLDTITVLTKALFVEHSEKPKQNGKGLIKRLLRGR